VILYVRSLTPRSPSTRYLGTKKLVGSSVASVRHTPPLELLIRKPQPSRLVPVFRNVPILGDGFGLSSLMGISSTPHPFVDIVTEITCGAFSPHYRNSFYIHAKWSLLSVYAVKSLLDCRRVLMWTSIMVGMIIVSLSHRRVL
jgi:hypothetical protein